VTDAAWGTPPDHRRRRNPGSGGRGSMSEHDSVVTNRRRGLCGASAGKSHGSGGAWGTGPRAMGAPWEGGRQPRQGSPDPGCAIGRGRSAPTHSATVGCATAPRIARCHRPAVDALRAGILHCTANCMGWCDMDRSVLNDEAGALAQTGGSYDVPGSTDPSSFLLRTGSGRPLRMAPLAQGQRRSAHTNGTLVVWRDWSLGRLGLWAETRDRQPYHLKAGQPTNDTGAVGRGVWTAGVDRVRRAMGRGWTQQRRGSGTTGVDALSSVGRSDDYRFVY
jgi:hypothetical protein